MLQFYTIKRKTPLLLLLLLTAGLTGFSQKTTNTQPVWWFGESVAANMNYYLGTTQMLNNNLTIPTAFHKGQQVKPYASFLTEYRPNKVWGGMLNIAYDNRGGKFYSVLAPCNCTENLSTNISYLTVEPSLRLAPFSSAFYVFAGPSLSFNVSRTFSYTQQKQTDTRADWSDIRNTIVSAQAGAGIDIPVSSRTAITQMTVSPFASFQTNIGHDPRSAESWSVYTVRAGIALKFGTARKTGKPAIPSLPILSATDTLHSVTPAIPILVMEKELQFSVRAPKIFAAKNQINETLPLLNSVFFEMSSNKIPARYNQLQQNEGASFSEEALKQEEADLLTDDRSARQLLVYYNILNILGDRMRIYKESSITLTGASDKNPDEGKLLANNVKQYLLTVFGIDDSRISTEGRDKPLYPSEKTGAAKGNFLLQDEDRRVDITTSSPELLMQAGENNTTILKPVQIPAVKQDSLDSYVLLNAEGANNLLETWSVAITDELGNVQHYGPYTQNQAAVPGKTILGNSQTGNYTIILTGQTKSGHTITKESSVSLMTMAYPKKYGSRYSILFGFDKSKMTGTYETFLTETVAPLIPENGRVVILGHTDMTGNEKHNLSLSRQRIQNARQIIEQALLNAGKKGVVFKTYGFGRNDGMAPFENDLPEKRFYNRTVTIDINPDN